jgi:hypothetical protein
MNYTKYFAGCALAVGLLAAGTPTAFAQDWRSQQPVQDQYGNPFNPQTNRNGYNNGYDYNNAYGSSGSNVYGYRNSYDQREELEQHIQSDYAKLHEAIRCGNDAEAARQAADLARDQRTLRDLQYGQNVRYDNRPVYNSPRIAPIYNRGWSFRFGWR